MDLEQSRMRELALFAGAGGSLLTGRALGWRTVCAVEHDRYRQAVLVARQNDESLEPFPIWDDVRTFNGKPWRNRVDIISGGFPCTDISAAGIDGERSGLWSEMRRIIGEVQPSFAFLENSPRLVTRGLARVLGDLATLGYDATWGVLGAADVDAWHQRDRIWILAADADQVRQLQSQGGQCEQWRRAGDCRAQDNTQGRNAWAVEPDVVRMVHGLANGLDRVAALGDGWVPQCASLAFKLLLSRLEAGPNQ